MIFDNKTEQEQPVFDTSIFHPQIIHKEDNFCIYLPECSVSGEGATLEEAYRQYEMNMKSLEERTKKYGLATITPDPYPILKKRFVLQELGLFFIKSALSVFAVILVVIVLLPNISAAIRNQVTTFISPELKEPKYWVIQLPEHINSQLDRLDREEEEKMLGEWNKLVLRTTPLWGPFKCP